MPKSLIKIEWHEPIDMFRSSATSLTVIQRLANIIFSTSLIFRLLLKCSGVRHAFRRSHLLGLLRTFCTTDKRCFGPRIMLKVLSLSMFLSCLFPVVVQGKRPLCETPSEIYSSCDWLCQSNCANYKMLLPCPRICAPGCVCSDGYVREAEGKFPCIKIEDFVVSNEEPQMSPSISITVASMSTIFCSYWKMGSIATLVTLDQNLVEYSKGPAENGKHICDILGPLGPVLPDARRTSMSTLPCSRGGRRHSWAKETHWSKAKAGVDRRSKREESALPRFTRPPVDYRFYIRQRSELAAAWVSRLRSPLCECVCNVATHGPAVSLDPLDGTPVPSSPDKVGDIFVVNGWVSSVKGMARRCNVLENKGTGISVGDVACVFGHSDGDGSTGLPHIGGRTLLARDRVDCSRRC
ncbi:hypothetical protein LAZ67_16002685 [Cordylochernes scorpioides]|uniref:TIL domain-containing protein n=1 Tax=Cordylochernes scorpioides TaxID=51811 RepID=A0ABY6LEX5_9ARAC|nr:hypothetical protein LAZ67_16002685 [Cordylochernes scorpioides]